ncbi:hypothetical protein IC582_007642 [Cucumis melo]
MDRKGQIPDEETKEVVNLIVGTPCKLAFETKDHVVAWGTIIDSDAEGANVKVAVDVVVDEDCAILIPSEQGMYKMSQEVGSHILWPRDLVITNNIKMDYGEFTKDMSTFAPTPIQNAPVALRFLLRMVEHMGSAIQITTPHDVFEVRRKCCIMIESLKDFTSMRPIATACLDAYIMYLYTRMESSRTLNLYKFVDAGSISCGSSKEERVQLLTARLLGTNYDQLLLFPYNSGNHWTSVVINLTKGAAFWIDPLKNRIDPDVTEVVERSFNIMNKKKPAWRVVKCVADLEVCIVVDKEVLLILKCVVDLEVDKCLNKAKGNPMAFYKVLPQSIGAMKPWICQLVDV